jgi:enterochelin esterase family protein
MGGMQTFQIGLANLPTLSYFGIFSGPPMVGTPNLFEGALGDAASFNKQVHLLWFGTGTTETAIYNRTKDITAQLEKAGIKYRYYESAGTAHEWQTWRRSLHEFAPLLFKQ